MKNKTKTRAEKINRELKKEEIGIGARTMGKIIKAEDLVVKYRIRKLKCEYAKMLLKIDVKYAPEQH